MPERLSLYFTLDEMIVSQTAARLGLDNTPPPAIIENLRILCVHLLDPIRQLAGHPIVVSSGYRSPIVNRRVGGSKTSAHMHGFAADITCPFLGQRAFFHLVRNSGLKWDQCINEFDQWLHIGYRELHPRGQVLVARRQLNGKTTYTAYTDPPTPA